VKALLSSARTGFVLVTSPNPLIIQEALFFHRALAKDGIRTAAVVVNRVQRDPRRHGGPDNVVALKEALQLAQIKDDKNLADRLCETLTEQAILADLDRREVDRLRDTLRGVPLYSVPRLRKDVHDLAGLWQIDEYLGGD
jgi:anion-transporting  ArsA/GET3 family ATPase